MKSVFLIKKVSAAPSDAVDTTNLQIFSFFSQKELICWADVEKGVVPPGAIRALPLKRQGKFFRLFERLRALCFLAPDYLVGMGSLADLPFILLKPKRTKYLVTYHSCLFRKGNQYWRVRTPWFLRRFILNKADLIFSPSEWARSTVIKFFPEKEVCAIHSGVQIELFHPEKNGKYFLSEVFGIQNNNPNILYVGTLQPRKRPDVFINIAKTYAGRANFIVVGKQVGDVDYISQAPKIPNFYYHENFERREIARLFSAADIFVFPSLQEPFGLVVVEAMACGLPVIVSRSGAFPEIVKDGEDGFLIDVSSAEVSNFTEKIREILENRNLYSRISKNATLKAKDFSWKDTAGRYRKILLS